MKRYILGMVIALVLLPMVMGQVVLDSHDESMSGAGSFASDVGLKFIPNKNVTLTVVSKHPSTTPDTAYIWRNDTGTVIASASFSGNDASFNIVLTEGVVYVISANNTDSTFFPQLRTSSLAGSTPINRTHVNFTWGYEGSGGKPGDFNHFYTFTNITTSFVGNPEVTLVDPINGNATLLDRVIFNASVDPQGRNLTNATLMVWLGNGTLFNETTNILTGDVTNDTFWNVTLPYGLYHWNVLASTTNSTDSFIGTNNRNNTLTVGFVNETETFNPIAYETDDEFFEINITTNGSVVSNANLFYGGTKYSATLTNASDTSYTLKRTINLALGAANKSFFWSFDVGSSNINTTNLTQSVNPINLTLCDATFNVPYLNITFRNESDDLPMNAEIDSATFYYYLGSDPSINHTLTYSHSTANSSYGFCFSPEDQTLTINSFVEYSADGFPQRDWTSTRSYSNTTTNQVLYLLASTDSISQTIQVVSPAGQPVADVSIEVNRTIGGNPTVVASGTTGTDGTVTFFLNPDFSHNFRLTKTGFSEVIQSFQPTGETRIITFGTSATNNITDYTQGIEITILPSNFLLVNDTTYVFNITLVSNFFAVDSFGFSLTNGSSVLGSNSASTNGGTVSLSLNTADNSSIVMDWFYIIDGNVTNGTRVWPVSNDEDFGFGLQRFFDDLVTYTNDGFLGMNAFSRTLIIFFFIFLIVGAVSVTANVTSPVAIVWLVFALVALFDIGAGLIINPVNAVPNIATILTGFAAIITTAWWVTR